MKITRDELNHLIQKVVTETASNACQAIRYAVKHQDFTDAHPEYRMGWIVGSKVCEDAVRPRIADKRADVDALVEGFCKDHSQHNVKEHAPPLAGASVETGDGFIIRVTLTTRRLVAVAVSHLVLHLLFASVLISRRMIGTLSGHSKLVPNAAVRVHQ